MIVTKTPLRVSLFGGGTDLETYYSVYGGEVLSFSIDKYVYVAVNQKFEPGLRVAYSKTENVGCVDEIEHPIAREVLKYFKIESHLEVVSLADIPANGSGLGSSSAFTVGLIHGISRFLGQELSKHQIASIACEIEIRKLKEPIGKQDQFAVSTGGVNRFQFEQDGKVGSEAITLSQENYSALEASTLLFYTGVTRSATTLLREQAELTASDDGVIRNLHEMKRYVSLGAKLLEKGLIQDLGYLLGDSWTLKKSLNSSVTNEIVDQYYELALSLGAWGGKILGAGGGGFFLFIADPSIHDKIEEHLINWRRVQISIDNSGTQASKY